MERARFNTQTVSQFTARTSVEYFVGLESAFGVIFDGWGTALHEAPADI